MSPFAAHPWSEEVLGALDKLERPSRPVPLSGSRPAGPDSYVIDRSVEETRAAYEAGEAELPEDSTVERAGPVVIVRAPFTETGIVFSKTSAGCMYTFLRGPTFEMTGFAPTGDVRAYAPVVIETEDMMSGEPKNMLVSELSVDGKPWLVLAGRLEEGKRKRKREVGAIVQTTFLEAQKQEDDFDPPKWPARFHLEDDGCRVKIGEPDGLVTIRARRTHGLCALMLDLATVAQ
jgi:hypothetical protein